MIPAGAIASGRSPRSLTSRRRLLGSICPHTARVGSAARFPASAWPESTQIYIFLRPATLMSLPPPVTSPKMPPSKGATSLTRVRSPTQLFANNCRDCKARVRLRGCAPAPEDVQILECRQILHLPLHPQALRTMPALLTANAHDLTRDSGMALSSCFLCGLHPI